jgi:ankyrin repeat protein
VRRLLSEGASYNYVDRHAKSALHLAVACGCTPVVQFLIKEVVLISMP